MPIITLAETKTLLQITDASKDAIITALILPVQEFILSYCQKFKKTNVQYESSTISFVASSLKIIDTDAEFESDGFRADMDLIVEGSLLNDGVYKISVITETEITLELLEGQNLFDEDEGEWITITRVQFNPALKTTVAKMINLLMNKSVMIGIDSEHTGSYSVSFAGGADGDYPKNILNDLNAFRKISL
jgi:hypothetical protein